MMIYSSYLPKFESLAPPKIDNNPLSNLFSISSEILIGFELALFMILAFPADAGRNEVPSPC